VSDQDETPSSPKPEGQQGSASHLVVDYGTFHADPAVIRQGDLAIQVEAVTGWASKLNLRTTTVNSSTVGKSTEVVLRVFGPDGTCIDLQPKARGAGRSEAAAHGEMKRLSQSLNEYGRNVIAPVLVRRLCQQVLDGDQLTIGPLTIDKSGLSRTKLGRVKRLAWADFYGCGINNGKVFPFAKGQKPGKRKLWPFAKLDMSVTNAVVLPSVTESLHRYYAKSA